MRIIILTSFLLSFVTGIFAQKTTRYSCLTSPTDSVDVTITDPSCFGVFDGELKVKLIPNLALTPAIVPTATHSYVFSGTNNGFLFQSVKGLESTFLNLQPDDNALINMQFKTTNPVQFRQCLVFGVQITSPPPFTSDSLTGPAKVCQNSKNVKYFVKSDSASIYAITVKSGDAVIKSRVGDTIFVDFGSATSVFEINQTDFKGCPGNTSYNTVKIENTPIKPAISGKKLVCGNTLGEPYSISSTGGTYTWTVTGATKATDNGNNITVNYAATNAKIKVFEISPLGCVGGADSINVTVDPLPVTTIVGSTTVCENTKNENYAIQAPKVGNTYTWNVTNGSIASNLGTSIKVDFTSLTPVSVSVTEKTVNNCVGAQVSVSVKVIKKPVPTIAGKGVTCQNTVGEIYTASGSVGSTFTWAISGATISSTTPTTATVNFASTNATLKLVETPLGAATCKSDTVLKVITVNTKPSTTLAGNSVVCENAKGEGFVATGLAGSTYSWKVTGATLASSASNFATVDFASTNATVTVIENSTAGCKGDSIKFPVTVIKKPTPTISGSGSVCENKTNIVYTASGNVGSTYKWVVSNATLVSAVGNTATINVASTNAVVKVIETPSGSSTCKSDTVSFPVTVNKLPITTIAGKTPVCENVKGEIYTASGTGSTYVWSITGATLASSVGNKATVDFGAANANLTVTETSSVGCIGSPVTKAIVVNKIPVSSISGKSNVCENTKSEIYTAALTAGSTYAWSVSGATLKSSSANTATIDFAGTNATISVIETNAAGCPGVVNNFSVAITKKPLPTLAGKTPVCENTKGEIYTATGTAGSTFKWFVSGATLVSSVTNKATVDFAGTNAVVKVVETTSGASTCASDTASFPVSVNKLPITTIAGKTPVCENVKGEIYTASGSGSTYVWSITGATLASSVGNKATVDFTSTNANLTVTETSSVGCIGSPVTKAIVVNKIPVTIISGKTLVCESTKGEIYTASLTAGSTYAWSVSGATLKSSVGNKATVDFAGTNATISVTETNAAGCPGVVTNYNVSISKKPIPNITGKSPVCESTKGEIYTATSSATSTYQWFAPNATIVSQNKNKVTLNFNTANVVLKVVETANGAISCAGDTVSKTIIVNKKPVTTITGASPLCASTKGQIYTASGASSTYKWFANNATFVGVPAKTATVDFGNVNTTLKVVETSTATGCSGDTAIKTIVIQSLPTPSIIGVGSLCASTKNINYSVSGGVGSSYNWFVSGATLAKNNGTSIDVDFAATNAVIKVIEVGTACKSDTVSFPVTVNALPVVSTNGNKTICKGDSTTLIASGAVSYVWSPISGLVNPSNATTIAKPVATTTYKVVGTNAKGCVNSATSTVTVNSIPVPVILPANSSLCKGSSVQLVASGGTKYSWSPATGLSDATIANPIANPSSTTIYTVTVDNGVNCKATTTTTVTVNPLPVVSISKDTTICLKQQAQLATVFDPTYTYSWSPAVGLSNSKINNPIAKPNSTSTYKVVVATATGCKDSASVTISVNTLPTASVSISPNDTICRGTVVTLTASGGNSYQWFPAAAVVSPTSAVTQTSPKFDTDYKVAVFGANGCADTARATIIIEPVITITTNIGDTICQGDTTTITANATNGVKFTWSPTTGLTNPNVITTKAFPLTTTKYTITVENSIGCINTDSVTVEVLTAAPLTVSKDTTICKGSSAQLMATTGMPNFTYKWTPSTSLTNANIQNPVSTPASSITYNVTATHATAVGCPSFGQVKINVNPIPTVNVSNDTTLCVGDSITLTATGGINYTWSPATGLSSSKGAVVKASPNSTTMYKVVGDNGVACTATDSVKVTVNTLPVLTVTGDNNICPGDISQLVTTPSNLVSYSWTPTTNLSSSTISNPKAAPIVTTIYKVTGVDANKCKASASFTLTVKAKPTLKVSSDTTICQFDTIPLRATSNASTIVWSPSTDIENVTSFNTKVWPTKTTTFKALVTSLLGCKDSASVVVKVNTLPQGTITIDKDILCFNEPTNITLELEKGGNPNVNGAYSFNRINFTTTSTFNYLAPKAGDSTITAYFRDLKGCISKPIQKNILTLQQLKFDTLILAEPSCSKAEGSVRVFNVTGGLAPYSIDMNGSSFVSSDKTFDKLSVGSYTFKVTDANLCSASKSKVFTGPISFDTLITKPVCFGNKNGSITIANTKGGVKPYQFSYATKTAYATDTVFKNLGSGNHIIFIKDATGCELSVLVPISTPDSISISELTKNDILCKNDLGSISVNTKGGTGALTVSLGTNVLTGPGTLTFDKLVKGTYIINASDSKSCKKSYNFAINDNPLLKSTFAVLTKSTCFDPTGSAKITSTTGGSGNYQYGFAGIGSFKDSVTFAKEISSLASGLYKVVTRDIDFGCTDTASFTIDRIGGIDLTKIKVNVVPSCTNTEGIIGLTSVGGAAPKPYNFELRIALSDNVVKIKQLDSTFTSLAAADYKVVIYDSIGCAEELPVKLPFSPGLNISVSKVDESCSLNNGQITLTVTGGTSPYLSSLNNKLSFKNQLSYSNLNEGKYSVYIKDSGVKNCEDSVKVTLIDAVIKPTGTLVATADTICLGSSAVVTAKLDSQFVSHPQGSFSFDLGKTYSIINSISFTSKSVKDTIITVLFRDATVCSVSDTIKLKLHVLDPVKFKVDTLIVPTCKVLGKVKVHTYSGGISPYQLSINGNPFALAKDTTISNMIPGVYDFVVKDKFTCSTTKQVDFSGVLKYELAVKTPTCFKDKDGSIKISNVTGGVAPYKFGFNDSTKFNTTSEWLNLADGKYISYIKDADNCLVSISTTLKQPDSLHFVQTGKKEIGCIDTVGQLAVMVSGGTSPIFVRFKATNFVGQTTYTFDNLKAGKDTLLAFDANSCESKYPFEILAAPKIKSYISQSKVGECNKTVGEAKIDSTVKGSGLYAFKYLAKVKFVDKLTMEDSMKNLSIGSYVVVTKDQVFGCLDTTIFRITRKNGVDSLKVNLANSCNDKDGFIKIQKIYGAAPSPFKFELRNSANDSLLIAKKSDSLFSNLGKGLYSIATYDSLNCKESFIYEILAPNLLTYNLAIGKDSCGDTTGSIRISNPFGGKAPYQYSLDNVNFRTDSLFGNLISNVYTVFIKDASNPLCTSNSSVFIPTNKAGVLVDSIKNITCFTGEDASYKVLSLYNTDSAYTYTFSLLDSKYPNFSTDPLFSDLSKGVHSLYIKQTKKSNPTNSCVYVDYKKYINYEYEGVKYDTVYLPFFEIQKGDSLGAIFKVEPSRFDKPTGKIIITSVFGGKAPFQVDKDGAGFVNFVSPLEFTDVPQNETKDKTPYIITLLDSNSCSNKFNVIVPSDFYVPNVFTPNGDGKNDKFYIMGLPPRSRLKVVDRWGVLSYESYNYGNDWDGGSSPDGTYFYDIKLPDGSVHTGWVQIVK